MREVQKNWERDGVGWGKYFLISDSEIKKIFSSNIYFEGINIQQQSVLLKSKIFFFKFIRPHSFCVRNLCCVNYLITIQIQSCIKLECCVHICPDCSGFDLCGRIKLHPAKHLVIYLIWHFIYLILIPKLK